MVIGIIDTDSNKFIDKIEIGDLTEFKYKLKDYFWAVDKLFDADNNIRLHHYDLELFDKFRLEHL